jgi:rubrerythrin
MNQTTYLKIIHQAIENEIEAYQFYLDVAQKTHNAYLKDMFLSFSQEEQKHRRILEKLSQDPAAKVNFAKVPDFHVAETVEEPPLTPHMNPVDAIALAMKKEQTAMEHYNQLADTCSDPDLKKIFFELANMERQHKAKMESAFVDIGYPEVW